MKLEIEEDIFYNGFKIGIVINVLVVLWIFAHPSYIKY